MACNNANPTLHDCVFEENGANGIAGNGGGMACHSLSQAEITGCIFKGNHANGLLGYASGLSISTSSPTLTNCEIMDNSATFFGAITCTKDSFPIMIGSRVCGNTPGQISGSFIDQGDNCIEESCIDCPCPDFNGDGTTDGEDLGILLAEWGVCTSCIADISNDGIVDGEDLGLLFAGWGLCIQ